MKRSLFYQRKTILELFEMYEAEKKRINREDAKIAMDNIKKELKARVDEAFRILDGNDDVNVRSLYNCFEQAALKSPDDDAWSK